MFIPFDDIIDGKPLRGRFLREARYSFDNINKLPDLYATGHTSRSRKMKALARLSLRKVLVAISFIFVLSVLLDWSTSYKAMLTPRPISRSNVPRSSIAKVSMLYGPPNPLYERALATHDEHNAKFGYPFYVLREQTLPGYWSKPAYILRLLLSELEKPERERLEWLVWVDGDVVIMNPNIPLEIFLPPEQYSNVNLVIANDHRGLNNGVFFLRVDPWSVWLMNACLNTQIYDPDLELEFGDQSAMEYWLNMREWRNNTMHVPQRWFNAYAGYRGAETDLFSDPLQPSYKFKANSVKEGDLLVHHAGHKSLRAQRMIPWVDAAEQHLQSWELSLDDTTYIKEIADFWGKEAKNEDKRVEEMIKIVSEIKKKKKLAKEKEQAEKKNKPGKARMR